MKKIAIYTGKGAYMAKDVEDFLSRHNFEYNRVHEADIKKGALSDCDIFIIGGGAIYEILPALDVKGADNIRRFVKNGGKYIGICAGAYIASLTFSDKNKGKIAGLGLVETQFQRGKGEKIVKINFPLCGEKIMLYYCNGPLIKKIAKEDLLIGIDSTGEIGILKKEYGKGIVYLFCAHPEGNLYKKITPEHLGSILFLKKMLSQ